MSEFAGEIDGYQGWLLANNDLGTPNIGMHGVCANATNSAMRTNYQLRVVNFPEMSVKDVLPIRGKLPPDWIFGVSVKTCRGASSGVADLM